MEKIIDTLIQDLKNIYDKKLISVILYGSKASSEFQSNVSDINIMVILDEIKASNLKSAYQVIKKWKKAGNSIPVFMEKEEWLNSADVFAIEYADIKDRHQILYGEDVVSSINIEKKHLRLQCEGEIRRNIIKLERAYLENSSDLKLMEKIIKKSFSGFIAIFRAVLRILEETIPQENSATITLLAEKVNFDKEVFIDILLKRQQNKNFKKEDTEFIIQKIIDSLNEIKKFIDKIE